MVTSEEVGSFSTHELSIVRIWYSSGGTTKKPEWKIENYHCNIDLST